MVDEKTEILAIFTCHNRKRKTENCVHSLTERNPKCIFTYVIVDDNSQDGTKEMLESLKSTYSICLLEGNGRLYYSGGMRKGMLYALKELGNTFDYLLMVNDDVEFFDYSIEKMILQSLEQKKAVIAGATCNIEKQLTYSAVKYTKGIQCRKMSPNEWKIRADTFNANAVLIPYFIFRKAGTIDRHYHHSLGDFDYGLEISRHGYPIYVSREFVGYCSKNSEKDTWRDCSLGRIERIRKKESVKGAPIKPWFYFLRRNFGFFTALKGCATPYIRILIGR